VEEETPRLRVEAQVKEDRSNSSHASLHNYCRPARCARYVPSRPQIMPRQCLNAEVASVRAVTHPDALGGPMDWLLHIDIDELFMLPGAGADGGGGGASTMVPEHFASVPPSEGFVAYVNHEAVPEHSGDIGNYFLETSLFKRNPNVFARQAQEVRVSVGRLPVLWMGARGFSTEKTGQ
jgi:hypothetical protein